MLTTALPQLPVHCADAVVPVLAVPAAPDMPLLPPPHAATNSAKQHPTRIGSLRIRRGDDPENLK
jgi:hypothetical protein